MRRKGFRTVNHHTPITKDDMAKLYSGKIIVFEVKAPSPLLNKVWFEIMYYLCRRGQENLRSMKNETFEVAVDSTWKRYVRQKIDELDNNDSYLTTGAATQGRMYE